MDSQSRMSDLVSSVNILSIYLRKVDAQAQVVVNSKLFLLGCIRSIAFFVVSRQVSGVYIIAM